MADRWQREANERLRLAKEAGQLEREHLKTQESILDLSNDLAAAVRERDQANQHALTPAELREQARAAWLEIRNQPDKGKAKDQARELETDGDEDRSKKDRGRSRHGPDDDFGM